MKLTEEQKQAIEAEYREFEEGQYAGKSKDERQKKGQFFTPPVLTIKMLEQFDDLNGTVLDPAGGAGGLIAAAVMAGADPRKCYLIELDPDIAKIARKRLGLLGVPRSHIRVGNALDPTSYEFPEPKVRYSLKYEKAMKRIKLLVETNGRSRDFDMTDRKSVAQLNSFLVRLVEAESECFEGEHMINSLNKVFKKLELQEI